MGKEILPLESIERGEGGMREMDMVTDWGDHTSGIIWVWPHLCIPGVRKIVFLKNLCLFWERERESGHVQAGEEQKEKERENPKQAPHCQCRAQCRAWSHKLWDHDLSQNQVRCLTDWDAQGSLENCLYSALLWLQVRIFWREPLLFCRSVFPF